MLSQIRIAENWHKRNIKIRCKALISILTFDREQKKVIKIISVCAVYERYNMKLRNLLHGYLIDKLLTST